jgi:ribonuclease P protein component
MPSKAWTICYTHFMLPSSRRIQRAAFPDSRIPAVKWTGKVLRIQAVQKKGTRARIAIIAAKKYYRTKITRNIFKRRVFSVVEKELPKLDTTPFGFFIIFPVIHTQDITFAAIASDIKDFMNGVIK